MSPCQAELPSSGPKKVEAPEEHSEVEPTQHQGNLSQSSDMDNQDANQPQLAAGEEAAGGAADHPEEMDAGIQVEPEVGADSGSSSSNGSVPASSGSRSSPATLDSGVNSEIAGDIPEDRDGHYLVPIGPARVSPSSVPNPDNIPISFSKPYVKHMLYACEILLGSCECTTMSAPRIVASFKQLVGPCPHLEDLSSVMSSVIFDLATFSLKVMTAGYQMQRVLKYYQPSVTRMENCRKIMVDTLSKLIQCIYIITIDCEDLQAYYTYFMTTEDSKKYPTETHERLVKELKSSSLCLENMAEAIEQAQVRFENANLKLNIYPTPCKNLGRASLAPANKSSSSQSVPSRLSIESLRKSLSSIGKKISDSWKRQDH